MFTIQYVAVNGEHKMQTLDSNSRTKLVAHLAKFDHPIVAVYEQATVITNTMRTELCRWSGSLSEHAREFLATSLR